VSNQSSINRRTFISAAWTNPEAADTERYGEIASILVQAKPDRLAEVETAISALAGCEIHGRDPKGKLVVVVEAASDGAIGGTLNRIAMTEGVLSAALVFHAINSEQLWHREQSQ
jgi:periplasmic nitrate reductase NapD